MSVNLELQGMTTLLNKLQELGKKGNQAVNQAIEVGAQPILQELQTTTVFVDRTGDLRRAQKVSKVKSRKNTKFVWVGDVDRKCPYAWPLELGTSKTVARPYMREAWNKKKQESLRVIKEELQKGLKI